MSTETGAAPAAPASTPAASSTPSQTPPASPVSTTADSPSSFAEALTARMTASAPVDPGTASPAPTPVAAPPVPPAQTETAPEAAAPAVDPAAQPKGPIPFERHESILKNAREKTRSETQAELTQQFQQRYGQFVELGNRIEADPVGTIVDFTAKLAANPQYGQAIISSLARMLGAQRGRQAEDQEPQPDLQTSDGTLLYSGPQLAKREAWLRQQMESSIDQRLQPLQQREQQREAQERLAQAWKVSQERATKMLEPYKQLLPDFEKNKPAVLEKFQAYKAEGHDDATALGAAVGSVLQSVVTPARVAESQQQLVAAAVAKSTGSTSPPGAAPSAPATRPTDFLDGFSRIKMA